MFLCVLCFRKGISQKHLKNKQKQKYQNNVRALVKNIKKTKNEKKHKNVRALLKNIKQTYKRNGISQKQRIICI